MNSKKLTKLTTTYSQSVVNMTAVRGFISQNSIRRQHGMWYVKTDHSRLWTPRLKQAVIYGWRSYNEKRARAL